MKTPNVVVFFASFVCLWVTGCASSRDYDPSLRSDASTEVIKVVSLDVTPAKPVAPHPWRVRMKVKNVSDKPLENLTYTFMLGGKGEKLGEGQIARLSPGQTMVVMSQ